MMENEMDDNILNHFEFKRDEWLWCEAISRENGIKAIIVPASERIPEGYESVGSDTGWAARERGSTEWSGVWLTKSQAEKSIQTTFNSSYKW